MPAPTSPSCGRCGATVAAGARFCANCGADVSGQQSDVATAFIARPEPPRGTRAQALLESLREVTLGEYEILGELGRGGMATVYLAHDIALDRKVAIKVISPALLEGEGMVERFKREARTAAGLSHPHIIPIFAVKVSEDILYFVMKFVQGRPLDSIIREIGRLPVTMVQAIFSQVSGALGYAHRRGVIHRDVKPANIMVDDEGWAVVTDFGIAKISEAQGLTVSGVTVGTPAYMSPEQCSAKPVTGASDQYSLGVVTYEMLTGRPPFAADSIMALMYAHFNEQPQAIRELRPDCPPALAAAVQRMLEKTPEKRWPHIEDAIAAVGGGALAHDDPTRLHMIELAKTGVAPRLAADAVAPTSPIPPGRATPVTSRTPVTDITLSPGTSKLQVGDTAQLRALVGGDDGESLGDHPVVWASSAPRVATVSPAGLVTAVGPGSAMITATTEGVSGSASITVVPAAVASVAVAPDRSAVAVGEAVRLTATALDARGRPLAGRPITWTSSRAPIAAVGADGLVSARALGTVTITAECEGRRGSAEVTVTPAPVSEVGVSPPQIALAVGETAQLRATTKDARGTPLSGRPVAWKSTDQAIAAVSSGGLVTATGPGTATIIATSETRSGSATLTVSPAPVAEPAAAAPSAAPPAVGRPTPAPTAVAPRRRVPAAAWWGFGAVAIVAIAAALWLRPRGDRVAATPGPAPVATVEVSPPRETIEVGATLQLTARVTDASGQTLTERPITWTSSDSAVARVSSGGFIEALGPGRAIVTATSETQRASATITVNAAPPTPPPPPLAVASVGVTPGSGRLEAGRSLRLSATVRDAAGRRITDRPVTWTTSDRRVATVSPDGLVNAVGAGSARITATSGGRQSSATVTVTAALPPAPPVRAAVASVALSPATRTLKAGETVPLAAMARDAAGGTLADREVRWSSSNAAVATVSTAGIVTAVAAGSAVIMAESEGQRATVELTVSAPPPPVDTPRNAAADRDAAVAAINALIADFSRALGSRQVSEMRRVYPGMPAREQERWQAFFDSPDNTDLSVRVARTGSPTINDATAEVAFVLTLSFRNRIQGQVTQNLPYRATLRRDAGAWRLTSLVAER